MSDLTLLARIMGFILGLILCVGGVAFSIQTAVREWEIECQIWQIELTDCRSAKPPGPDAPQCLEYLRDDRPVSCPLPESK